MGLFGPNVKRMKAKGDVGGLIALLESGDEQLAEQAEDALGDLGAPAVAGLLPFLSSDRMIRWTASGILQRIGEPAVEPLSALVSDRSADNFARYQAATILGRIGDLRAFDPLMSALADGFTAAAGRALGRLGDPRAAEGIYAAMCAEKKSGSRQEAAVGLAALGDARAIDELVEAARSEDEYLKKDALEALATFDDPRAKNVLDNHEAHRWDLIATGIVGEQTRAEKDRKRYEDNVRLGTDARSVFHTSRLRAMAHKAQFLPLEFASQADVVGPGADAGSILLGLVATTCEEAARALETGMDPNGQPIEPAQVAAGLRAMTADSRSQIGLAATALDPTGVQVLGIVLDDIDGVASHLR